MVSADAPQFTLPTCRPHCAWAASRAQGGLAAHDVDVCGRVQSCSKTGWCWARCPTARLGEGPEAAGWVAGGRSMRGHAGTAASGWAGPRLSLRCAMSGVDPAHRLLSRALGWMDSG